MRTLLHNPYLLASLLTLHLLLSTSIGGQVVVCLGAGGHFAVEPAGHERDCAHACPDAGDSAAAAAHEHCEGGHGCVDIALLSTLLHRPSNEEAQSWVPAAPAQPLIITALQGPAAPPLRHSLRLFGRGSPACALAALGTVVLRL